MSVIELTVRLDIPLADQYSDAELRQAIFDEFINFNNTQHLMMAMKAMVLKEVNEESSAALVRLHQTWASVAQNATFEIRRETMGLTDRQLECCWTEVVENIGITPPSQDELRRILDADSGFVAIMRGYYPDPDPDDGFDTQDRDMLVNAIARDVSGAPWPTYGDGPEAKKTLEEALTAKGWKFS